MSTISMGICFGGLEEQFTKRLLECYEQAEKGSTFGGFTYIETGIAEGRTFSSVTRLLKERNNPLRVIGVDLENGWSLDRGALEKNTKDLQDGSTNVLISFVGSQIMLGSIGHDSVHFYLCDSCHEKDCVIADFLLAVPLIRQCGMICFHDSDPRCQGKDVQPHKGEPIGVRAALEELGLLNNSFPGWELVDDIQDPPGDSRGFVIVRKL